MTGHVAAGMRLRYGSVTEPQMCALAATVHSTVTPMRPRENSVASRPLHPEQGVDRRVLSFVVESITQLGYAPTLREIQAGCALRSLRGAQESLVRLERHGLLRSTPGRARSLEIVRPAQSLPSLDANALLRFFSVTTHGFYPYVCRAAALAPSRPAAEGWLNLVMDRLRHLAAIDAAIARQESVQGVIRADAIGLVDAVWKRYDEFLPTLSSWIDWVVMEEYSADLVLSRGFEDLSIPTQGTAATVLEGQFEIAAAGRRFVADELARLATNAADLDRFDLDVGSARRRVAEFYRSISEPLDRIWVARRTTAKENE